MSLSLYPRFYVQTFLTPLTKISLRVNVRFPTSSLKEVTVSPIHSRIREFRRTDGRKFSPWILTSRFYWDPFTKSERFGVEGEGILTLFGIIMKYLQIKTKNSEFTQLRNDSRNQYDCSIIRELSTGNNNVRNKISDLILVKKEIV